MDIREFHTKQYNAQTNLVAEHAKSLQRTFPQMSWNRAIQVAEREIADRHVEIPPEPSQPGVKYADVRNLAETLLVEIEKRTANDEFRQAMIDTHKSLVVLARFL